MLDGIGRAGLHIVREAKAVAHFVADHIGDQLAFEVVRQRQFLGARIERRDLNEIPVPHELEDVVINDDVGFQDFAGARIVHVRAHGVFNRRRQPHDRRVTGILGVPIRVFLFARRVLGEDGVGKARRFEGGPPGFDSFPNPRPPFVRHAAADVENNRFLRFGNRGGGVFFLQPPAGDVAGFFDPVFR